MVKGWVYNGYVMIQRIDFKVKKNMKTYKVKFKCINSLIYISEQSLIFYKNTKTKMSILSLLYVVALFKHIHIQSTINHID